MSWNAGHLLKSGQYKVIRLIGSGGFGMTYLAKDLNLARQVVIKRPNLSFEADRDYDKFLRRFKREGQVLAQVEIPNIVGGIEFTEIEGMPCLVMDFVAGETLNECIRRRKFIPEDEAWQIFRKLASAVEALHQQGIIHCDIHPGNIIVQPNGEPMLIDFGSTKLLHPTTWTVTTTYNKDFSPYEQMVGSEEGTLDPQPAWDIYSLAANMFFAVTGQKPMPGISRKLYGDSLKSPNKLKPDLTDRLNNMILQGMSLEAKNRPNMYDFEENLINQPGVRSTIMLTGLFSPNKNRQRRAKIEMKQRARRKKNQQQNQPKIAEKTDVPPKTIPSNPNSKYDSPESVVSTVQLFVPTSDEKPNSSIIKEDPETYFPLMNVFILVLGYFFQGVILGNHSISWAWSLFGPWFGALYWAMGRKTMNGVRYGAWYGALTGSAGVASILFGVGASTAAFTMAFAGFFTLIVAIVMGRLKNNHERRERRYMKLILVTPNGSLLSGGFSGYLTNTGVTGGVYYGLITWVIFMAVFFGYANSEDRLEKKYGEIQICFIYGVFSSIGSISGVVLGSWLKVAGIVKLL